MKIKIAHILIDDKFIAGFLKANVDNSSNIDYYLISKSPLVNLKYFNKIHIYKKVSFSLLQKLNNYDVIVFHTLRTSMIYLSLIISSKVCKVWIGFGADYNEYLYEDFDYLESKTRNLYFRLNSNHKKFKIKSLLRSNLKKIAISRFDYFAPILYSEYLKIKLNYNFFPSYIEWKYMNISEVLDNRRTNGSNILVGNSATFSNNHIEIFDIIKMSSIPKGVKIICPLNYGNILYREEIINLGKEYFGDDFLPITDFMDLNSYYNLLSECSICLMNHIRQQALGNIYLMLSLGAQVFMNENSLLYKELLNSGFSIYPITEFQALYSATATNVDLNMLKVKENVSSMKYKRYIDNFYSRVKKEVNKKHGVV